MSLLLVDASEGPLPQTRYAAERRFTPSCCPLLCSTKSDCTDARPAEVLDEIYDLFIDLEATEDQLDFPVLYTNAKTGVAHRKLDDGSENLQPLFETIVSAIPEPKGDPNGVLQAQVMNLDYSDFLGRIAIGRVFNGTLRRGSSTSVTPKREGRTVPTRITEAL